MESDLEGAIHLIAKFEGIPLVTELCPITPFNMSNKLLSRIRLKRLSRLLSIYHV